MGAQSMKASSLIAPAVHCCRIQTICFRIIAIEAIDIAGASVLFIGLCKFDL